MTSQEARLEQLRRHFGSDMAMFQKPNGKRMYVPGLVVVDAYLRWLGDQPLGLDPAVAGFVSQAVITADMPDMVAGVIQGAREQFRIPTGQVVRSDDDPPDLPADTDEAK